MDHFTLLFVSSLAPNAHADTVTGIAKQARRNNWRRGLTGLLVFDGKHFCQFMEGPMGDVLAVADLMETDRRHERMEVLLSAAMRQPRSFPSWELGYLLLDLQESGLGSLRNQRGKPALEAFKLMLPALDAAVGQAVPERLWKRSASGVLDVGRKTFGGDQQA